jgi:hypothetical protein
MAERAEPGDVFVFDRDSLGAQLVDCGRKVAGDPQRDGVDDQAEHRKLIFLPFALGLPDLAVAAVAHLAGQAVPGFLDQ